MRFVLKKLPPAEADLLQAACWHDEQERDLGSRFIDTVELAVEKGASVILMPVSSRKQLFDLSDDLATKITAVFYSDAREAFIKAVADL